jgi:predicted glycosyltransferase
MPEVVVKSSRGRRTPRLLTYSGIKEDVYVPDFHADSTIFQELGLSEENIIVTVRPPATEAHYHNPEAEILFERFMELAFESSGVQVVLLPRNKRQDANIRSRWPHWFGGSGKVLIPKGVVNGLNLLWASDLVVSGGGTMNREAAAMGVPVYSIFRGTIGAVDRQLQAEGRLILIERPGEIASRIELKRRPKDANQSFVTRMALTDIVGHIERILSSPR